MTVSTPQDAARESYHPGAAAPEERPNCDAPIFSRYCAECGSLWADKSCSGTESSFSP